MTIQSNITADPNAQLFGHPLLNLTDIMLGEGIRKIEIICGRFFVVLCDGRSGVAGTAGEAFKKACLPDAENVSTVRRIHEKLAA